MTNCCSLYAGALNRKVVFERATSTADGMGGVSKTWAPVGEFNVKLRAASTHEKVLADRKQATITHIMFMRYNKLVEHRDRVTLGGRIFKIVGRLINIEEADRWFEIRLEEGAGF